MLASQQHICPLAGQCNSSRTPSIVESIVDRSQLWMGQLSPRGWTQALEPCLAGGICHFPFLPHSFHLLCFAFKLLEAPTLTS